MPEVILFATAACIVFAMLVAYGNTGDSLHPLVFMGVLIAYIYVVRPVSLLVNGQMEPFFPDVTALDEVLMINLAGVALFCLGCLTFAKRGFAVEQLPWVLDRQSRRQVFRAGCVLGFTAVGAYLYMLYVEGSGFVATYSRAKAHVGASTGYIGDAWLLAFPAIVLVYLSWQGQRMTAQRYALVVLFASPHLIHGVLGTRRGPLFVVLCTLFLTPYLVNRRRPQLWQALIALGAVGLLVFFVYAHRQQIFLGSDFRLDLGAVEDRITASEAGSGDDFIFAAGIIRTAAYHNRFYWGMRYVATYLVRPIPKQLWPTKYEDLGMGWMTDQRLRAGFSDDEWIEAVGWVPPRGAAAGFVADLFLEFSWWALAGCFVIGWFYGYLWRQACSVRGIWSLLYLEAAVLSVYLPTQSVSAVFHRFLFMSIPTLVLWWWLVKPEVRRASYRQWLRQRAEAAGLPPLGRSGYRE